MHAHSECCACKHKVDAQCALQVAPHSFQLTASIIRVTVVFRRCAQAHIPPGTSKAPALWRTRIQIALGVSHPTWRCAAQHCSRAIRIVWHMCSKTAVSAARATAAWGCGRLQGPLGGGESRAKSGGTGIGVHSLSWQMRACFDTHLHMLMRSERIRSLL